MITQLGGLSLFIAKLLKECLRPRGLGQLIMAQILAVTLRSLPTVAMSALFVGAIMVTQFSMMLGDYQALSLLGGLNTSATVREVGPLLISFLLAGRVGAYTAAELGTMRVTEQIDAIACLGANPLRVLIVPRFLGILFSSAVLLVVGLTLAVAGSAGVAALLVHVDPSQYILSIPRFTDGWTVGSGVFKSFVYSGIVASVACFQGYTASGGARGVGRAVTATAVMTNVGIVLANSLCGLFIDALWSLTRGIP